MENRDARTYAVIGAAMEVHTQLGCGFLETVYHEALSIEMVSRNIAFKHEVELPIFYKGKCLQTFYRADFICFNEIIVELKALAEFGGVEKAQILNYLKATNLKVGLLLNFGAKSLEQQRFVL